MISVEVCANSIKSAIEAEKGGATRVELCANLLEGGTTPPISQIELTRENINIDLNVLIRPRGGDFLYDEFEFESIKRDILYCSKIGCDGVVVGILNADGSIDIERNKELIALAKSRNLSVTFHRAFDRSNDLFKSLQDIILLGFDRVLTSGGFTTAIEGKEIIRELMKRADDKIAVMAGAGINELNVRELVDYTNVKEVHGTFQVLVDGKMAYRNHNFHNSSEYSYLESNKNRIENILKKVNNPSSFMT